MWFTQLIYWYSESGNQLIPKSDGFMKTETQIIGQWFGRRICIKSYNIIQYEIRVLFKINWFHDLCKITIYYIKRPNRTSFGAGSECPTVEVQWSVRCLSSLNNCGIRRETLWAEDIWSPYKVPVCMNRVASSPRSPFVVLSGLSSWYCWPEAVNCCALIAWLSIG